MHPVAPRASAALLCLATLASSCMRARREPSEICRAPAQAAMICVFQTSGNGWTDIVVDGKPAAGLDNGEWLEITVEPGGHVARASTLGGAHSGPVDVNVRPGETQALEVLRDHPSRDRYDIELSETRIDEARERILNDCKPNAPVSLLGETLKPEQ